MQNLSDLLRRLLERKIDFVLVGGFASVVHGTTLVTQDLDICLLINDEQISKLKEALKDLHPVHRMNPGFQPSFLTHPIDTDQKNIYLATDWGILDILSELPPAGHFDEIKSRAIRIQLFGEICSVISIDDLLKIKRALNRPKDQQAVIELEKIKALKK